MTQKQVMGHLCRGSALTAESPAHGAERGDVRPRPLPSRGPSAHRALWSTPTREGRPAGSGRSLRRSTREDRRPDMAHTAHRPGRLASRVGRSRPRRGRDLKLSSCLFLEFSTSYLDCS